MMETWCFDCMDGGGAGWWWRWYATHTKTWQKMIISKELEIFDLLVDPVKEKGFGFALFVSLGKLGWKG